MTPDRTQEYLANFTDAQIREIAALALVANAKRHREGGTKAAQALYRYIRKCTKPILAAHREGLRRRAA